MKAPEKIHVQPNAHDRWFEGKIPNGLPNGLFVEYTRTDSVIDWLKNKAENYIVDTPLCSYFDYKRAVEDFKDYMKGE